jgi:hypothetical protein
VTTIEPIRTRTAEHRDLTRRRVTGTAEEVAATVAIVRNSGHLVACTAPRQLHPHDPRVTVIVTVRDLTTADVPVRRRTRRWVKPTVITAGTAVTLAGLGYALSIAVASAARAVATPAVLGALFVLVLIIAAAIRLTRGGSGCAGLHCSGCGRH